MILLFIAALALMLALTSTASAETCVASEYYRRQLTADGSIFNTHASKPYTVAHKTKPFGTVLTITNLGNGRVIQAKVVDRGPFIEGRCVDLGRAGAHALGMDGLAQVSVQ